MTPTPLIFAATCDIAGKVRGKAFPADQLKKRLNRGVGWTPTNVLINCFDKIAESPFGSLGDLLLVPDEKTEAKINFANGDKSHFMLGDIVTLEGEPWDFCTRSLLKSALARLHKLTGVHLISAFEHEFMIKGEVALNNQGFGLEAFDLQRDFCETLMGALSEAGIGTDSIMKEFGSNQFEVVIDPQKGIGSADAAVILREISRKAARVHNQEITFTPIRDVNDVGNGVHIHMSFVDDNGQPVTYDENGACGMSKLTSSFAAGVLKYLEAIVAITAPSVVSYERLTPHRWSAAYNNLGFRDREASLRICPVTAKDPASIARQFNIEYRAADAAACPHLALAAIVHAGAQGIEEGLIAPKPTQEDLSILPPEELEKRGVVRLPQTLRAALEKLDSVDVIKSWFPEQFLSVYQAHKLSEIQHLSQMDTAQCCAAYEETY